MKIQSLPTYLRPFQKKSLAAVFFLALLDFFGNEAKKKGFLPHDFLFLPQFFKSLPNRELKIVAGRSTNAAGSQIGRLGG
jgi:hypothetical protein